MKKKDFKDLRNKDIKDLKKLATEKKLEALKVGSAIASGREKNLKLSVNLRREVAKILTLIREKEIIEALKVENEKGKEKIKDENI